MTVFEIVATVVLCIFGLCTIFLWGQVTLLTNRILDRYETEKKPAPKNEADEEK